MPTHPLAALPDGRRPRISSGFGPRTMPNGKVVKHVGADISFAAVAGDPPPKLVKGRVVYTANRSKAFFSPAGRAVHASEAGVVVQAKKKPRIGGDVWIHHTATGRVTRYAHLSRIDVKEGERVGEGQRLGIWGAGARTPFVHLHFELLRAGVKNSQTDPRAYLDGADVLGAESATPPTRPNLAVTPRGATAAAGLPGGAIWLLLLLAIGARRSTRS